MSQSPDRVDPTDSESPTEVSEVAVPPPLPPKPRRPTPRSSHETQIVEAPSDDGSAPPGDGETEIVEPPSDELPLHPATSKGKKKKKATLDPIDPERPTEILDPADRNDDAAISGRFLRPSDGERRAAIDRSDEPPAPISAMRRASDGDRPALEAPDEESGDGPFSVVMDLRELRALDEEPPAESTDLEAGAERIAAAAIIAGEHPFVRDRQPSSAGNAGLSSLRRAVEGRLSRAEEAVAPGSSVGNWRIDREVGRGGLATVYRAVHEITGIEAAIKVLSPRFDSQSIVAERFTRSVKIIARLRHGNLVSVVDGGLVGERPYVVMSYVDGTSLDAILRKRGPFSRRDARNAVRSVAQALAFLHKRGIVHRDVKPSNVLVERDDGTIRLADFDLIRVVDSGGKKEDVSQLTRVGTTLGTAAYMSPEQIRGEPVDGRADLYSLGALWYELLTGTPPFGQGSIIEMAVRVLGERPVPVDERRPDVDEADASLITSLIARDPDERPEDADALLAALAGRRTSERMAGGSGRVGRLGRHAPGRRPSGKLGRGGTRTSTRQIHAAPPGRWPTWARGLVIACSVLIGLAAGRVLAPLLVQQVAAPATPGGTANASGEGGGENGARLPENGATSDTTAGGADATGPRTEQATGGSSGTERPPIGPDAPTPRPTSDPEGAKPPPDPPDPPPGPTPPPAPTLAERAARLAELANVAGGWEEAATLAAGLAKDGPADDRAGLLVLAEIARAFDAQDGGDVDGALDIIRRAGDRSAVPPAFRSARLELRTTLLDAIGLLEHGDIEGARGSLVGPAAIAGGLPGARARVDRTGRAIDLVADLRASAFTGELPPAADDGTARLLDVRSAVPAELAIHVSERTVAPFQAARDARAALIEGLLAARAPESALASWGAAVANARSRLDRTSAAPSLGTVGKLRAKALLDRLLVSIERFRKEGSVRVPIDDPALIALASSDDAYLAEPSAGVMRVALWDGGARFLDAAPLVLDAAALRPNGRLGVETGVGFELEVGLEIDWNGAPFLLSILAVTASHDGKSTPAHVVLTADRLLVVRGALDAPLIDHLTDGRFLPVESRTIAETSEHEPLKPGKPIVIAITCEPDPSGEGAELTVALRHAGRTEALAKPVPLAGTIERRLEMRFAGPTRLRWVGFDRR